MDRRYIDVGAAGAMRLAGGVLKESGSWLIDEEDQRTWVTVLAADP